MRMLVLLTGFSLLGLSAFLSFQHLHGTSWAAGPQGPVMVEMTPLAAPSAASDSVVGKADLPETATPRISLATKAESNGARFVKAPSAP